MAIVNLCDPCKHGQHESCRGGSGRGQLVFCCTCKKCQKDLPAKEWKKRAEDLVRNLKLDTVQTLEELYARLSLETQRLGNEILGVNDRHDDHFL